MVDSLGSSTNELYFEETLSRAGDTANLAIVIGVAMLVLGVIPATVVLFAKALNNLVWIGGIVILWGGAAFIGRILWRKKDTTVDVRVTDSGIRLTQTPTPFFGTGHVSIPFAHITRVQYCLPDSGENIHLTEADKKQSAEQISMEDDPVRFMVARQSSENAIETGSYLGGVRIERTNGPPVYIGSDQPETLATVIAEHSDTVDEPEEFFT